MASRQEEKEARRKARLEQEAKEAKAAAARKRLQMVFGGVLGVLVIAGAVIAILAAAGGKDDDAPDAVVKNPSAKLPAPAIGNVDDAAEAAGCTITNPPNEGAGHESKEFKPSDYGTNPPTSGKHFPEWADDGIYAQDNLPPLGKLVHTLEHGRIDVQYKPGTDAATVDKLEAFLSESDDGYHMLLFPNDTDMDAAVAATAWDWSLTCPTVNDKIYDALRTFRAAHIDKGPENVP